MIKSVAGGSDVHGRMSYAYYEPKEIGLYNVALNIGATVESRNIFIAGYQHFQIWLQGTGSSTVQVTIRGIHPALGSPTPTTWLNLAAVGTNATFPNTVYWGVNLSGITSSNNDSVRFGRYVRLRFKNTGAVNDINISAWLECMG